MKKIIELLKLITSLLKFVILAALMACLVLYLSAVVRPRKDELPNDTSKKVSGFYALEENSLDILFMGTSHTYYGFNPSVIYENTGLSSYVFAGVSLSDRSIKDTEATVDCAGCLCTDASG